jgi:hypothetical protein
MFRDRPAMKEPHGTIRVELPVRLIDQLNQMAETRRDPLRTFTRARSQIVAELLDQALAVRCTPLQTPALRNEES